MSNKLELVRLGLDTKDEFIVYIHAGCSIDKSEANDPTRESMWKAFLRKNELEQKSLTEVIAVIRNLIQTPFSLAK
ncbi:TPA: hypothetical protein ACF81W_002693 [Legionella pneumophila]